MKQIVERKSPFTPLLFIEAGRRHKKRRCTEIR
jgi:hypothetical protein